MELPELTGINNYAIDLTENKQILYGLIYSVGPVELETLKTYIKIRPMGLSGLACHRSEIRSCSFPRKTEAFDYVSTLVDKTLDCLGRTRRCVSSNWIGQHTMERKLVKATVWRQPSRPVTVFSSIKPCAFRTTSIKLCWETRLIEPLELHQGPRPAPWKLVASLKMKTDFWELVWAQVITRGASAEYQPHLPQC